MEAKHRGLLLAVVCAILNSVFCAASIFGGIGREGVGISVRVFGFRTKICVLWRLVEFHLEDVFGLEGLVEASDTRMASGISPRKSSVWSMLVRLDWFLSIFQVITRKIDGSFFMSSFSPRAMLVVIDSTICRSSFLDIVLFDLFILLLIFVVSDGRLWSLRLEGLYIFLMELW